MANLQIFCTFAPSNRYMEIFGTQIDVQIIEEFTYFEI